MTGWNTVRIQIKVYDETGRKRLAEQLFLPKEVSLDDAIEMARIAREQIQAAGGYVLTEEP